MTEGYTGRKLNKYIWIPKSKTDLREYREFLKICSTVQERDGYFSDKTIGVEMVKLRAIVDRDNTADSYVEKYEIKKIADQSYVSNARMLLRILRWMGLISKDYDSKIRGKFYLTPLGESFLGFHGPFPSKHNGVSELDLFEESFAGLRYYCVNDDITYRNPTFKQRPFLNMIRFLDLLNYASHYELALSSLVLKNESIDEIEEKLNKVIKCRENGKDIRWLMNQYEMNCEIKSTVTGIYDGPKVLLSFARQMRLVEEIDLSNNKPLKDIYRRMYNKCGYINEHSAKKITKITEYGKEFLKKYCDKTLIWFDDLEKSKSISSIILLCTINKSVSVENLKDLNLVANDLDPKIFSVKKGKIFLVGNIDFNLYRDIPYESRLSVINMIKKVDPLYFNKEKAKEAELHSIYCPDKYPKERCLECYLGTCCYYRENFNSYGGRDRFPWRVCPENLLSYDDAGVLSINTERCVGCGLCAFRCSFDGIGYNDNFQFYKLENKIDTVKKLAETDKKKLTDELEKEFFKKESIINKHDIPKLVNHFIESINNSGYRWEKDACYTYVRNIFRTFGVDAIYSGSGGMKTRSDVTVEGPFIAVSEVKSPAESPINLKAVRQAIDAAVQKETNLTMAIGVETHSGAIDQELKYRKITHISVLLLEIKYLSFISYIGEFINFTPDSLKRLISENKGKFDSDSLKNYLEKELALCEASISAKDTMNLVDLTFPN